MRWVSLAMAMVTAAILVVLWMKFHRIPAWYVPVEVSVEDLPRIRSESSRWADDIGDKVVRRRSFEIELHEFTVNEFLAALPDIAPDADRYLPREVLDPCIDLRDGEIHFGARLVQEAWQCIVTLAIAVQVTDDGRYLAVALRDVRGGSLSIPQSLLQRVVGPLLEDAQKALQRGRSSNVWSEAFRDVDSVGKLYEGVRVRNRFTWPNGNRRFRIESITVLDGVVKVVIDPL